MPDMIPTAMAEATRLTRDGRLAEATAVIQRALRGATGAGHSPMSPADSAARLQEYRSGGENSDRTTRHRHFPYSSGRPRKISYSR